MRRTLVVVIAGLLDAIVLIAVGGAVASALGAGGRLAVGPLSVSITSGGHAMLVALWVCVIRAAIPNVRVFGLLSIARLPKAARNLWRPVGALSTLSSRDAARLVLIVIALSGVVKLAIAYTHPGFWTGDDVEVHEMTFAKLFGWQWRAWELRMPFYPLGVIFPAQYLAKAAGFGDAATLVFVGRAVVAVCSLVMLWLTFRSSLRLDASMAAAILGVVILATNQLHTVGGTTELPRTVSTVFVVAAFALLLKPTSSLQSAGAGGLIAIASAMRFSEEIFVAPVVVQLLIQRRWRDLAVFAFAFLFVALAIFGVVDQVYWGEPFFSLKHIVDFTLVKRLSTRGYEPFYEYVTRVPVWTNPVTLCLAIAASRRLPVVALWTWLPLALLSILPHKEPRYLIPILPFLAILAAHGLWVLLQWVLAPETNSSQRRSRAALVLLVACVAALMTEMSGYVAPRSNGGVAAARYVAGAAGPAGSVVVVQSWRIGGRLYLPSGARIIDLTPENLDDPAAMTRAIDEPEVRWVILTTQDLQRAGNRLPASFSGFAQVHVPAAEDYRVYERRN